MKRISYEIYFIKGIGHEIYLMGVSKRNPEIQILYSRICWELTL
jgi:hypothetical protein